MLVQNDAALGILRRLDGGALIRLLVRWDAAKILFNEGYGLRGINVADDGNYHVRRDVIRVKKMLCVGGGEAIEVGNVSHSRPVIWVRCVSFGHELLDQPADWVAISAHAALFGDHVPFFVELAKHGMRIARRLHISPQLKPIDGKGIEVAGIVLSGEGIYILNSVPVEDFAEFIRHHVLLRVFDRILPGFLKLFEFCFVTIYTFVALVKVSRIGVFHFLQCNLFGGIVLGPDCFCTFEGLVLEHVCKAGLAHWVLSRANIHVGKERENWSAVRTLANDCRESVG